jgi:H+-transporting ATPase
MPIAARLSATGASPSKSASESNIALHSGLTSEEARHRLEKLGANTTSDTTAQPLLQALSKFWAPVPWMLEAAIVLQVVLGDYPEAAIIAGLLVFNAALGLFQESRAHTTSRAD